MNRKEKRMMKYRPKLYMEIISQPKTLNYKWVDGNRPGRNRHNSRKVNHSA